MVAHISRRDLFRRGGTSQERQGNTVPGGILPPWAAPDFARLCDGCGACVPACPEQVLVSVSGKGDDAAQYPRVQFGDKECTFCGDCVTACDKGALVAAAEGGPDPVTAFHHHMHITAKCLSWRGISCRICEENCETRAIRFYLQTEGRAAPDIQEDACTGCGACIAVCPEQAITISENINSKPAIAGQQGGRI